MSNMIAEMSNKLSINSKTDQLLLNFNTKFIDANFDLINCLTNQLNKKNAK